MVSTIPMLGASWILLAKYMPWVDAAQWGSCELDGTTCMPFSRFAVPNAFIIAAILFAIAVLARNEVIPFIGALVLLIGYIAAGCPASGPSP